MEKRRRLGSYTTGIVTVTLGLLWLAYLMWDIPLYSILVNSWPVIIILFGIEVILNRRSRKQGQEQQEVLRVDRLGLVLMVCAFVFSVFFSALSHQGNAMTIRSFVTGEFVYGSQDVDVSQVFQIPSSVDTIEIDIPVGVVEVRGANRDSVGIEGTIKVRTNSRSEAEQLVRDNFNVFIEGRKAIIRQNNVDDSAVGFLFTWIDAALYQADLKIAVPDSRILDTRVTNGSISVYNMNNHVGIKGANGKIHASNIGGDLQLSTNNGKIEVERVQGNVDGRTSNGVIELQDAFGAVSLKSTNGSIETETSRVGGDWTISTTNGRIAVHIPQNSDVSISARTTTGRISGGAFGSNASSPATSSSGNGKYSISLSTTIGAVDVNYR